MTEKFTIVIIAFLFAACQTVQPIQTNIAHSQSVLSDEDYIAVIQPYDTTMISRNFYVGSIRTPAKGKSVLKGFSDIMKIYDSIAQKNGANIIRLLNVHYALNINESDKVAALLYRVPDIRAYEKRIFWKPNRKLVWDDFKGAIPDSLKDDDNYSSYANIGIQHRSNASFLIGTDRFFVLSSFDCNKSWYRPYAYFQTNYLDFQQGLFDLTELYARKMRQKLADKNIDSKDKITFMTNVDKELGDQYKEAESKYVMETRGGADKEAMKEWHNRIWKELAQL